MNKHQFPPRHRETSDGIYTIGLGRIASLYEHDCGKTIGTRQRRSWKRVVCCYCIFQFVHAHVHIMHIIENPFTRLLLLFLVFLLLLFVRVTLLVFLFAYECVTTFLPILFPSSVCLLLLLLLLFLLFLLFSPPPSIHPSCRCVAAVTDEQLYIAKTHLCRVYRAHYGAFCIAKDSVTSSRFSR